MDDLDIYCYLKDAMGEFPPIHSHCISVESGQYISDSAEQSTVNDKLYELLKTITSSYDILSFFGLDLSTSSSKSSLIKCKKSPNEKDEWQVINIIIIPRKKPKNGLIIHDISIHYMTVRFEKVLQ